MQKELLKSDVWFQSSTLKTKAAWAAKTASLRTSVASLEET